MGPYIRKIITQQPSHPLNLLSYHSSSIQLISDTHIMNFILNSKETGHSLQVSNTCKALTCTMIQFTKSPTSCNSVSNFY